MLATDTREEMIGICDAGQELAKNRDEKAGVYEQMDKREARREFHIDSKSPGGLNNYYAIPQKRR